ncbi:purine-nucleoside phosphorylase [Allomuricauda sp. SCSIO 65647]|uniref:purine-nucleoside phosphorylase n=1 Tax=Allomuricauda sp. SCSIO 65647 TaxID=2908843 RepID=UPI001F1F1941|nr:purine-nucleoside phosphorylase [Muricauda sp. SCSIO 65647]UJH67445.1 purine-nucleoside phosphorylase [Muricauda sp. SCSIO 65647]
MAIHINAKKGDIAPSVLLPGDPLRAKWIAETFLKDVTCYNQVRGMLGYTGDYKGKRISVQGGGMGIPSTMIYCHELVAEYGVQQIIRVGSAGSYQKDVRLGDIVLALSASTDSAINASLFQSAHYAPTASFELLMKAVDHAKKQSIEIKAGNILSSDIFYDDDSEYYKQWANYGVLCVEMESAGIYTLAAKHGIEALSILTISDSLVTREQLSHEARESSFTAMAEMALAIV